MTIQEKYNTFVRKKSCIPSFALASIRWKDSDEVDDALSFKLSDDTKDDNYTFFYTDGVYGLEFLADEDNGEDFYILEDTVEFYK